MGANAQTSVPLFAAGEVLTAANMNISAGTGVPVFATTTTRDAAFGGTGEKTLAQGQLCYLESTNVVQYYNGSVWATVGPASAGALTYITSVTLSGASTAVSNVFSSTYANYKVVISGATSSTAAYPTVTFGSTTTGYYWGAYYTSYSAAGSGTANGDNAASISYMLGYLQTATNAAEWFISNPNVASNTSFVAFSPGSSTSSGNRNWWTGGHIDDTTQYTGFTITHPTGTFSAGTVRVYGIANS